ncbi:MAG: hypothetical protein HY903_08890 [Deltaproteobacteria bacterium]|nr:hypothetical protein [Deltaproteobacteria bacterium]
MVLALLVTDSAAAYVLPADFVLRMLVEKRRRLGIADITVTLSTEIDRKTSAVEERLYIKDPEKMRRVRTEDGGTKLVVIAADKAAAGPEGALKPLKAAPDILPLLLQPAGEDLEQTQSRLVATLHRFDIDTEVVSLGRLGNTVAYVIGAKPNEADKAQLWIDKESFVPLKIITPQKKDAKIETTEVRWLEFGSAVTGDWFPRVIEVWKDGRRLERSEATKVEINKKIPDTLFTLP